MMAKAMQEKDTLKTQEKAIITSLYAALLDREPSENCLASYASVKVLSADGLEIALRGIVGSPEFRSKHLQGNACPKEQISLFNDQTQFGEFGVLLESMIGRGVPNKIVVDVGARGKERSNSYDLIKSFGFRGILIEANPSLIKSITSDFAGLDVEIHNVAVSDYEGEADFTIGVNDDVSSLTEANANSWGENRGKIRTRVKKLSQILKSGNVPLDFALLSVDAEGEDIRIINETIDHGFRPQWIIAELSRDFKVRTLEELPLRPIIKSEYTIAGQTAANLILMRS